MIDYILISKNLKDFSEFYVTSIFFVIILCILFWFLFYSNEKNSNEKKWHNKLSWNLTLFVILFATGFELLIISHFLNKTKELEKRYSVKAETLNRNIEVIENEIEFFTVKDKNLYINQILNKFYKNERNLNSVEKEIIGKLVK